MALLQHQTPPELIGSLARKLFSLFTEMRGLTARERVPYLKKSITDSLQRLDRVLVSSEFAGRCRLAPPEEGLRGLGGGIGMLEAGSAGRQLLDGGAAGRRDGREPEIIGGTHGAGDDGTPHDAGREPATFTVQEVSEEASSAVSSTVNATPLGADDDERIEYDGDALGVSYLSRSREQSRSRDHSRSPREGGKRSPEPLFPLGHTTIDGAAEKHVTITSSGFGGGRSDEDGKRPADFPVGLEGHVPEKVVQLEKRLSAVESVNLSDGGGVENGGAISAEDEAIPVRPAGPSISAEDEPGTNVAVRDEPGTSVGAAVISPTEESNAVGNGTTTEDVVRAALLEEEDHQSNMGSGERRPHAAPAMAKEEHHTGSGRGPHAAPAMAKEEDHTGSGTGPPAHAAPAKEDALPLNKLPPLKQEGEKSQKTDHQPSVPDSDTSSDEEIEFFSLDSIPLELTRNQSLTVEELPFFLALWSLFSEPVDDDDAGRDGRRGTAAFWKRHTRDLVDSLLTGFGNGEDVSNHFFQTCADKSV